jgi:histidine triad (HIT) family protein
VEDATPALPGSGRYGAADCIFCAIAAGSAPASIVYDDADLLAFLTIGPVTPGHLLIIPKRHAPFLADLDEATGARMLMVAMRLARALRASGLRCEGINLFLADGEAAFQEVFHTHLHVIPRFVGDTFRIDADWSNTPSRAELDDVATRIRLGHESQAGD